MALAIENAAEIRDHLARHRRQVDVVGQLPAQRRRLREPQEVLQVLHRRQAVITVLVRHEPVVGQVQAQAVTRPRDELGAVQAARCNLVPAVDGHRIDIVVGIGQHQPRQQVADQPADIRSAADRPRGIGICHRPVVHPPDQPANLLGAHHGTRRIAAGDRRIAVTDQTASVIVIAVGVARRHRASGIGGHDITAAVTRQPADAAAARNVAGRVHVGQFGMVLADQPADIVVQRRDRPGRVRPRDLRPVVTHKAANPARTRDRPRRIYVGQDIVILPDQPAFEVGGAADVADIARRIGVRDRIVVVTQ